MTRGSGSSRSSRRVPGPRSRPDRPSRRPPSREVGEGGPDRRRDGWPDGPGRRPRGAGQITPEESRHEGQRLGPGGPWVRRQRHPDRVVLASRTVAQDLVEGLLRQVGPAQELEVLPFGPHQTLRRQALARRLASPATAGSRPRPAASSAARTRAEPTITPSASRAARRAASGVAIPKPIASGAARRPGEHGGRPGPRAVPARPGRAGPGYDVEEATRQSGRRVISNRVRSERRGTPCRVRRTS